ncbi:antibiotic biosynthesis monooxygenase [Longirhabdus pacifica]|uniref:antibiotic biosynthesis monooxygenase n=1 Tax=Longirhabdus pacifica TaxID=2305227 RepID=UPI001008EB70|nr:antibiotic biosynthesis monooxygenase [Longirhabdus pacifica]
MIVITNTIKVKEGYGEQLIERFQQPREVQKMEGFLGMELLQTEDTEGYHEFVVRTKWVSQSAHDEWVKSDAFKRSHSKGGPADYMIDFKIQKYQVVVEHEAE